MKINDRRDILLLFLYSPGKSSEPNQPIMGRTRLVKMLFLERKHREYQAAAELDANALIKNLRDGEEEYLSVAGSAGVSHLRIWQKVFNY